MNLVHAYLWLPNRQFGPVIFCVDWGRGGLKTEKKNFSENHKKFAVLYHIYLLYIAQCKHLNIKIPKTYLISTDTAFCAFSVTSNKKSLVSYLPLNSKKLGVNPWDPEIVLKTRSVRAKPWGIISLCLLLRPVTGQCWRPGSGSSGSHPKEAGDFLCEKK